jgi:Pregnancy-associated plasma protein-A/Secretion system C-terminal sorting domain/Fibronectin type III domain
MRYNNTLLSAGLLLFLTYTTFAQSFPTTLLCSDPLCQRTCATHSHLLEQLRQDTNLAQHLETIERHTQNYTHQKPSGTRSRLTIPVVVHVVARNATENISDEQIRSQIQVLNRDFNQLNTDITKTPSVFRGQIANCEIDFALALRTPEGFPTNGIARTMTTGANQWSQNDEVKYTDKGGDDAWDATRYLNIWICNMDSDLLGYASFPGYRSASDGIVINYKAFGTLGTARAPYNLGRTLVHEIGHWLNLLHLWGDEICGDDRVSDTPPQRAATYGLNNFPRYDQCLTERNLVMSMNFMDYCYDDQMFFFTKGQKERMWALFSAGGFREKLASSDGCTPVTVLNCAQRQTPDVLNVGVDSARVRWLPMKGVQAYQLVYSLDSTDIWISQKIDDGTTACTLKNLLAASQYKVKIQALNCPQAVWSNIQIFDTQIIGNQNCAQNFPYNNRFEKAMQIPNDQSVQSQLTVNKDEDWFRIKVGADKPYCKILLSQLSKDYDIGVYNSQKKRLYVSTKGDVADEEIILNDNTEGSYWLQVIGHRGVFDAGSCYTLTVNTAPIPFSSLSKTTSSSLHAQQDRVLIYPNPARDEVYILPDLQTLSGAALLTLTNVRGQKHLERAFEFSKNAPQLTLNIVDLPNGLYFLTLRTATKVRTEKLLIAN